MLDNQFGIDGDGFDGGQVFLIHFFAQQLDFAVGFGSLEIGHLDGEGIIYGADEFGQRSGIIRRQLAAVFAVDFITVEFCRIVAGGNHDAAGGFEFAHGEG